MIEQALTLLLVVFAGALFYQNVLRRPPGKPRPRSDPAPAEQAQDPLHREKMFADVTQRVKFGCHPVLHKQEANLFRLLEQRVQRGWKLAKPVRVLAQVNMGEFLHVANGPNGKNSTSDLAQKAINSKRIDILLTCFHFHPRVAVEYQGRFHRDDEGTRLRDDVKRQALSKAGVELVEVVPDEDEDSYMPRIHAALKRSYPAAFS